MKALVVGPTFLEWDLGTYVSNLLRGKGVECSTFEYWTRSDEAANRGLVAAVERFSPDVLFGLKMEKIRPQVVREARRRGVFCLLWYVDCDDTKPPAWMRRLAREVDMLAVTAKGMIPAYQALTPSPVCWAHEGVYLPGFPLRRPGELRVPALYRSDVAFVGNIYYPSPDNHLVRERHDLLKCVQRKFDLKVWGPQGDPRGRRKWGAAYPVVEWPAYHGELVRVCHGAKIVLGTNRINIVELYFSNRTFLTLAAGGFHLTRYVPGLEQMFTNREHLVWFHTHEECMELIEHYLKRPAERRRIARAGQQWVRRRYSMKRQVNRLLAAVGRHREAA